MRWVFVCSGDTGGQMIENLREEVALLDRHLSILGIVLADGPIGIVELANRTGFSRYQVRYSLRMLEDHAVVKPTPDGAIPGGGAEEFLVSYEDDIDRVVGQLSTLGTEDVTLPAE